MTTATAVVVVAQVVLPLGLLLMLAFWRHRSRFAWLTDVVLVGIYLVAIGLVGSWLIVPRGLLAVYIVLAIPALGLSLRTSERRTWPLTWRGWSSAGVQSALVLAAALVVVNAVSARRPPREPWIDLGSPLSNGQYFVANGGSTELVNAHLMTLTGDRYRTYRGQSYGVDLVRLNRLGMRASGVAPSDPARYVIFGDPIVAPCSGTIVTAVDGVRDLSVPIVDRTQMAGNHVILACRGVWVVLAHMRAGSVRVRAGDEVALGDLLGSVGNSGNSDEPHLHIHAQLPAPPERPLSGAPVPIRINGRYLVRNAVVEFPALSVED